jgi:hypothetical protein
VGEGSLGREPAKKELPYGTPVPGKPGLATSPFAANSGYVDVIGFPPGTAVEDPYTGKIFLTPSKRPKWPPAPTRRIDYKGTTTCLYSLGIVTMQCSSGRRLYIQAFNFVRITKELEDQRGCTSSQ